MIEFDQSAQQGLADRHIESCRETLTNPKVVRAIGDRATVLLGILDDLYLCDYDDGKFFVDVDKAPPNYIPLMISEDEERLDYDAATFANLHPQQVKQLHDHLIGEDIGDPTDGALQKYLGIITQDAARRIRSRQVTRTFPKGCSAAVSQGSGRLYVHGNDRHGPLGFRVATRPFMMINVATEPGEDEVIPHELVHIEQALRGVIVSKVSSKGDYTALEIEAYEVQNAIARALGTSNKSWLNRHAAKVEKLRKETRDADHGPYDTTPELRRRMKYRYDFQFCPKF